VIVIKDTGIQKLRALGIRGVFGLVNALCGASKALVANILAITPEMADDMLSIWRNAGLQAAERCVLPAVERCHRRSQCLANPAESHRGFGSIQPGSSGSMKFRRTFRGGD
jgi:hypothetical protein